MTTELDKTKKLLDQLLKAKIILFPKKGDKLQATKKRGVYIIRTKDGRVDHVGRTPRAKNGIHQRLNNHLNGQSSYVYHELDEDPSKLREGYTYQYLEVEDPRERALLEVYAIGVLCPKHLR